MAAAGIGPEGGVAAVEAGAGILLPKDLDPRVSLDALPAPAPEPEPAPALAQAPAAPALLSISTDFSLNTQQAFMQQAFVQYLAAAAKAGDAAAFSGPPAQGGSQGATPVAG